jgi:hypothetical protein
VTVHSATSSSSKSATRPTIDCSLTKPVGTDDNLFPAPLLPRSPAASCSSEDTNTVIYNDSNNVSNPETGVHNMQLVTEHFQKYKQMKLIESITLKIFSRLIRVPWKIHTDTIVTRHKQWLTVPTVPTAMGLGFCGRRNMMAQVQNDVRVALLSQIHKMVATDADGSRVLTIADTVYLSGKYTRAGPLLWAQTDEEDMYVLVQMTLWPQQDEGYLALCCGAGDSLGVCNYLSEADRIALDAEVQLGPDQYGGYCDLPFCL